ncbi:MAG: bifunctional UDP-N-acetylmuramoyl-tripeptide:D-alanyl-D-alanine ligase/alanine racemase [Bacteroidaceae bacterium]|nr:bifunctional UDP-N-acetylmuramoyl-tripeptide:D-alanyl-D-alanine ligase/alanine racemase [Bacteroidaceae bacterium]
MNYSIKDIIRITGCKAIGSDSDRVIDTLLTDSRSLLSAESTLFFAITTAHGSGMNYIGELYDKGVRGFALDSCETVDIEAMPEATFLVGDALQMLQSIAAYHRAQHPDLRMVGITGSNGKTIVKEWLYQLIGHRQPTVRSPRSYNSQIGVPFSLILIQDDTQLALIEAGISQPSEMEKLESMIRPQTVVLTNIGSAHQENFSDLKQKTREKLMLARNAQKIVYPADDPTITETIAEMALPSEKLFGWSMTDTTAQLYISHIESRGSGSLVAYSLNADNTEAVEGTYTLPFIDNASIHNSITCLATAIALGYDHGTIAAAMPELEPMAMRLEVIEGQRNLTIINDSYNSDVNSLSIALDFMGRRTEFQSSKVAKFQSSRVQNILILSDILQSSDDKQQLYAKVAELVAAQHIDLLIAIGKEIEPYLPAFTVPYHHFATTEGLLNSNMLNSLHDATVLVKGARIFRFDKITALLEKRVHETILEVNLNAIVDNLNHYRSLMHPDTKIVCMVKASAYGAGSIEVSKTLQDHKVDYLAVAVADEGVALRQAGIRSHIMVMNPEMTSFHDLFQYHLEPEIYNFKVLQALIRAANHEGVTNFPVHIKLDTGMHRLGFHPVEDIERLITMLRGEQSVPAVKPVSVFSHFVGSDGAQFDDFTHQQFAVFDQASRKLQQAFRHRILRHICNSAAIERFPQYHLDMVRLGIGLYGINPFDNSTINAVSTLRTTILQIREVAPTDTVGYSRWGKLTRPSRIADIPIGYADGLNRHLGRGVGYCIVNGQRAPYVGNICMDVAMIDVTDIPCSEGDSVEIFGGQLPVTVLSDLLDTIPYEILTSVSERVKRVYYND